MNVVEGDRVNSNTVIGTMANTGRVYSHHEDGCGTHLDFEIMKDGRYIDPEPFLKGHNIVYTEGDYGSSRSGSCSGRTMSWSQFSGGSCGGSSRSSSSSSRTSSSGGCSGSTGGTNNNNSRMTDKEIKEGLTGSCSGGTGGTDDTDRKDKDSKMTDEEIREGLRQSGTCGGTDPVEPGESEEVDETDDGNRTDGTSETENGNADAEIDNKLLRNGSEGEEVRELQQKLKDLGYDIEVDGKYGPQTEDVVKQFQEEQGLSVDGIVGDETMNVLEESNSDDFPFYEPEDKDDNFELDVPDLELPEGSTTDSSGMSNEGIVFLQDYEQAKEEHRAEDGLYAPEAYDDGYGYMTIGYGHLIRPGESFDEPITKEEAEELLRKDLEIAENYIERNVTIDLTQNQQDALVSLIFNVGTGHVSNGGIHGSQTIAKLNAGDFEGMAEEWAEYRISSGEVSDGLIRRRADELEMFFDGDYTRKYR